MKTRQLLGIGIIAILVLMYVSVFSLFRRTQGKKEIEIYFADRMTDAHWYLIDQYNELHKGSVKVIPVDFPNSDFSTDARKEILARSLRGEDDAIDLLAADVVWIHRFAKWCEPMGQYFSEDERRRFFKPALNTCYDEGELVAIPLEMVQSMLYYREDLLQKYPEGQRIAADLKKGMNWTEFLKIKKRLQWKSDFYIYPAADYEGLICGYIEILLSMNPKYFETTGFRFDTPEAAAALQLLVDFVQKDSITPPAAAHFTEVPSFEYFIRHDGLFLRGWTSYDKDFKNDNTVDSVKEQHLAEAPLPYMPGGKSISLFGGWNLMIAKSSAKKEAAVDFVKFLLSNESQEIFYTKGGYSPVINSFYSDSVFLRKYPKVAMIKRLLQFGVHRPLEDNYTKYSQIMARYFNLAIMNKITVASAMRQVQISIESEKNVTRGM